jgi:hypothetical protein
MVPMYYISETIEAHMSAAVATLQQRDMATLHGHLIFGSVFKFFNRLAKASGFCLYFYSDFHYIASKT